MKKMSTEGGERRRRGRRRFFKNILIHPTKMFRWLRHMEVWLGVLLKGRYLKAFMLRVLIHLDLQSASRKC
jgi:hypothetical protein